VFLSYVERGKLVWLTGVAHALRSPKNIAATMMCNGLVMVVSCFFSSIVSAQGLLCNFADFIGAVPDN